MRRLLRSTAIGLALALVAPAMRAPDLFIYRSAQAENGPEIPSWIEASCCGGADVHRLSASQVRQREDGAWLADGYNHAIMPNKVQASQDQYFWIFYRDPDQTQPYCFFAVEAF